MTDIVLYEKAKEAKEKAYAPYSGYKVGAAILTESGQVYTGCNVECASSPCGICAERVALAKAVSEGNRKFSAIAVSGDEERGCTPCGACRQALMEFSPEMKVIYKKDGKTEVKLLTELLPDYFAC